MKKEVMVLLLLGILLISPLVLAQEQTQTYSGFNRFTDNLKLAFSSGDNEVRLALDIREKEVNSAINNVQNQGEDKAIQNLERAKEKLQIVQEKVSLETSEEIKTNVNEIINKVNEEENLPEEFDEYLLEEEKTQLTAILTEKTYEYCSELAKEDFALMLKDEGCNPKTAPEPLKDDLAKLKDLQERMFVQLMLEIRSCIDDPGTCNCEANTDIREKAKCEKMVALAIKCEYKEDETSCSELNSLEAPKAESFVPNFLMNLFRAKKEQMLWGEKPSDCVPEECWDENDKPECRQYDKFKETKEDWDEYGNFIGTRNKCGKEGLTPTMQESIPQCFEGDVFLEEKCGKITMVENEDGLINYIIENEINKVIDEFENKSEQHLMEIRSGWMMVDNKWVIDSGQINKGQIGSENWTIDGEQNQTGNKVWEIKQEMNQIQNQIVNITYATGTGPGGVGGVVVDGGKNIVEGDGSGGESRVVGGGVEVKTGGGHEDALPIPDLHQNNPNLYDPDARAPGDTIDDTYDDELTVDEGDGGQGDYAEGTTGGEASEGTNNIDS